MAKSSSLLIFSELINSTIYWVIGEPFNRIIPYVLLIPSYSIRELKSILVNWTKQASESLCISLLLGNLAQFRLFETLFQQRSNLR